MRIKKFLFSLAAVFCSMTLALGTACGGVYLDSGNDSASKDSSSTSSEDSSMIDEDSSAENSSDSSTESSTESSSDSSADSSTESSSDSSVDSSTESSSDSSTDSSTDSSSDSSTDDPIEPPLEEALAGFPTVNAAALVDFVVDVPVDREPVVLQLSDTQIIDAAQQETDARLNGAYSVLNTRWSRANIEDRAFRYIREAIDRANPDLIVLAGDNVYGEFDDSGYATQAFIEFMNSFDIPWAPVMGNHDCETAKGVDWLCSQYENASNCLFKRNTLTGNGNYSIGITQGGKLARAFFMLDSASSRTNPARSPYGFATDEINWYTQKMTAIKQASAPTGISVMTHVPMQAAVDVLVQRYGYTNTSNVPIDLDQVGQNGDFGVVNEAMGVAWDSDYSVWNGLKALGMDSIFVGHVHAISAGVTYEGVKIQFGLKTGTYDALNYRNDSGNIVKDYADAGNPITGATVIPVSRKDASVSPYHIVTQLEEDKVFNETLTPLEKDTAVTTVHITKVGAHSASAQNTLYLRFLDATNTPQFLELPAGTNSTNNTALKNFAKQIVFSGVDTLNNVGVLTSQQDTPKMNFNLMIQLTNGENFTRYQYLRIPKGATYEIDYDGNGKIDTVWTFDREFKVVYDPYACVVREGLGGCNGQCDAGEWHVFTFENVATAGTTYSISSGSHYHFISSANAIGFKFISSSGTVNLGYTTATWTAPDDDTNAFKKYIKINGNALPTTATLQGIDQTDAMYLAGISLNVGDVISIEKGATFTHGNVTMILTKTLSWTWDGTAYTCTAS